MLLASGGGGDDGRACRMCKRGCVCVFFCCCCCLRCHIGSMACLPCCRFVTIKYCKFSFDRIAYRNIETIGGRRWSRSARKRVSEREGEKKTRKYCFISVSISGHLFWFCFSVALFLNGFIALKMYNETPTHKFACVRYPTMPFLRCYLT